MNNIDKDIERCKELIKTEHANWIGLTNQDAIAGVLSELESYRGKIVLSDEEYNKVIENAQKDIRSELYRLRESNKDLVSCAKGQSETISTLNKELETYKKIAEKLAEEYIALESRLDETVEIDDDYCNFDVVQCFSFRKKFCKECIIDWARKEVEKDV